VPTRILCALLFGVLASCGACPVPVRSETEPRGVVSVRIATFNLKQFGPTKAARPDVVEKIAGIIRQYDLVAVQEIQDRSEVAPQVLLSAINQGQERYAMMLSPRSGQQPNDLHSQEQYAYYYRASRVAPTSASELFDDSAHDYFQREPHVVRFGVVDACASFVLINVHTKPLNGVTAIEIAAVEHVFEWSTDHFGADAHVIALGDFNAGCGYAAEDELDALPLHGEDYDWVIPHSADTTVADRKCPFDRIVFRSPLETRLLGEWGIDSSFTDASISDHWPAWAEFRFPVEASCGAAL